MLPHLSMQLLKSVFAYARLYVKGDPTFMLYSNLVDKADGSRHMGHAAKLILEGDGSRLVENECFYVDQMEFYKHK